MPADHPAGAKRWHFNACVLDEASLTLSVGGVAVELERKPLEVLRHFLRHPGVVLTKDDILQAVWPGRVLSDTVLTKAISRIREVCGHTDAAPLIKTVHRYGYRFASAVTVEQVAPPPATAAVQPAAPPYPPPALPKIDPAAGIAAPRGAAAPAVPASDAMAEGIGAATLDEGVAAPSEGRRTRRRLPLALGALLGLGLAGFVVWHLGLRNAQAPAAQTALTGVSDRSVAVLPFENLSADPGNAFFAIGIQDEILTQLSKIGALKVISRTSTRQYAAKPANLKEIAHQLGVATVLEGSVQKAGDTVKVTVQLIRAETDEHLWAESYSKKLDDVFAVEGEVAQNVAEALKTTLSGEEVRTLAARPTENPEAYEAYLRGRAFDAVSFRNYPVADQALGAYLEAARLDPKFALAWARAAVIGSYLYFNHINYASEQATAEMVQHAAEEALRLQPDLPEALLARGAYKYRVLRNPRGGREDFKLAQQKLPNDSEPLLLLMYVERRLGYWDAAVRHAEAALDLDPRNFDLLLSMAYELYWHLRRFETARALANRAAALQPDSEPLLHARAEIEISDGKLDAAAPYIQRLEQRGEVGLLLEYYVYRRQWDRLRTLVQENLPNDDAPITDDLSTIIDLGVVQHILGDEAGARHTFSRVLTAVDRRKRNSPIERYADLIDQAVVLSRLGSHKEALAAITRAKEVWADDAIYNAYLEESLNWIRYRAGEREAAITALPHLLEIPNARLLSKLRLDPELDPIRDDPRVQALIEHPPPIRLDAGP